MTLTLAMQAQPDPAVVEYLGRIATAQIIMMLIAVAMTLFAFAGVFLSYKLMKRLAHTLEALDKVIAELAPRAQPLLDGATRVAADASAITESLRRKITDVLDTVEHVNTRLRAATDAAEQKVQHFGAVLDVVQGEAEEMILGAASTARGIHTTARALRQPVRRRPPLPGPRDPLDPLDDAD